MSLAVRVAARLVGRRGRVLLHSGSDADSCGGCSFVACEPVRSLAVWGRTIALFDRHGALEERRSGDPLAVIEALVAEHCADWPRALTGPVPVAMGYLGYELGDPSGKAARGRAEIVSDDSPPDAWLGFYDAVWRCAGPGPSADIVARSPAAARALSDAIAAGSETVLPAPRLGPLRPSHDDAIYRDGVARVLEYIRAGDVYQVNVARRLVAPVKAPGDPLALYSALDRVAPAPYGAVITADPGPGWHVLSGSPERFLHRAPGSARLETRPIKGTRRCLGDPVHDRDAARDLAADPKERAEHLMIVDLERNDLGRVARIGSISVDRLGYIVELPHLYHMVSQVSCELDAGAGLAAILQATFPGGSITGAPKIRACEIIAEVEPARRGPYTGAIGYFGLGQAIDLCVAIRTVVLTPAELVLWVGGGIVADSSIARELEETEEKAAGWRSALAGASWC